jgi:hypothetical protein
VVASRCCAMRRDGCHFLHVAVEAWPVYPPPPHPRPATLPFAGYAINASWLAVLPALGILAVLALNDDLRDRMLRAAQPGAVRIRLPRGRVMVLVRPLAPCVFPCALPSS